MPFCYGLRYSLLILPQCAIVNKMAAFSLHFVRIEGLVRLEQVSIVLSFYRVIVLSCYHTNCIKFSLRKHIKCSPSTLLLRNLKEKMLAPSWCRRHRTRHSWTPPRKPIVYIAVFRFFCPFVLYCFTTTVSSTPGRSQLLETPLRDYVNDMFIKTSRFRKVIPDHTQTYTAAAVFKFSWSKSNLEKLRSRFVLVWTVGLTGEIKLHLQISPTDVVWKRPYCFIFLFFNVFDDAEISGILIQTKL